MPSETLTSESIQLTEPNQLLSWTRYCRMGWEEFLLRKHNGLTEQMRLELQEEFCFMREVVRHLIPEEPVRVEDHAIVYDPIKMELNKIYTLEVDGRLHIVRKTHENIVETFELESIKE